MQYLSVNETFIHADKQNTCELKFILANNKHILPEIRDPSPRLSLSQVHAKLIPQLNYLKEDGVVFWLNLQTHVLKVQIYIRSCLWI